MTLFYRRDLQRAHGQTILTPVPCLVLMVRSEETVTLISSRYRNDQAGCFLFDHLSLPANQSVLETVPYMS